MLPFDLLEVFLRIADPNTRKGERGIETLGILAGKLVPGRKLHLSHLVIPDQDGDADNCAMKNEEDLSTYFITNGLLMLGWIHVGRGPQRD